MAVTIAVVCLCVINLVTLAVLVRALGVARAKIAGYEATIREFLSAPDDKTPSPLAQTVDQASQLVARALIAQAKATFMGEASAVSKAAAKAEAGQAQAAMMARFPWLAAIAALAPGFSKTLTKNPALLNLVPMIQGGGRSQPGGNGRGTSAPPALDMTIGGGG